MLDNKSGILVTAFPCKIVNPYPRVRTYRSINPEPGLKNPDQVCEKKYATCEIILLLPIDLLGIRPKSRFANIIGKRITSTIPISLEVMFESRETIIKEPTAVAGTDIQVRINTSFFKTPRLLCFAKRNIFPIFDPISAKLEVPNAICGGIPSKKKSRNCNNTRTSSYAPNKGSNYSCNKYKYNSYHFYNVLSIEIFNSFSCLFETSDGAPIIRSFASPVFGNAITSRMFASPCKSITIRSIPGANPPCGGAP